MDQHSQIFSYNSLLGSSNDVTNSLDVTNLSSMASLTCYGVTNLFYYNAITPSTNTAIMTSPTYSPTVTHSYDVTHLP